MELVRQDGGTSEIAAPTPAVVVNIRKLQPVEIVLLSRYATESTTDDFPALDECADDLKRQLRDLPQADLPFARQVYRTFAMSPFPIDRLNVGLVLRPLTLADHDTGLALWYQLVRDEHHEVRRDIYQQLQRHFVDTSRPPEVGLAEEGLTLEDAQQLRDAFIAAQYGSGRHVIGRTVVTEALETATESFASLGEV